MTIIIYFLPMKRILLVGFDGFQTLDLAGPAEVFAMVNRRLGRRVYRVLFASRSGTTLASTSGMQVRTTPLRRFRPGKDDTVLVVGGPRAAVSVAVSDRELLAWIARAARRVRRIGSVCTGAFVLAAAGVLDGRRAATHWSACARLKAFRSAVDVDPASIFVRDDDVWTSAGVTTGIDMALAMVEEDQGTEMADAIAQQLVLYLRRPGFQTQFSDALVAQNRAADPLRPAVDWARANLQHATPEALAERAGVSGRTFHRRCLGQLGTTPAKLLEKLRVEHARALLATTAISAKVLAVECGFGNPVRMKRAFERELGIVPREYRLLFGVGMKTKKGMLHPG